MTSWGVGVGLGSLDFAAAGLEGTDVGGADVFGEVVPEPDEHPASATMATVATIAIRFLMFALPSSDP